MTDVNSLVDGHDPEHALQTNHLTRGRLSALAIASYIPAVGIATFPFLLFGAAGNGSWLAALLGFVGLIGVGIAIIAFARRFVVTGSLYSYIAHVFGPWSKLLMAVSLFLGYIAQTSCNTFLIGIYAGSFLHSVGVDSAQSTPFQIGIYALAILISCAVAYRGLDISVTVAVGLALISLPLVIIITIASAAHTGLDLGAQLSMQGSSWPGVFTGLAAGAAFLVAFESCAALAAETKEPRRSVPWAVMSVPVVLGLLYLAATFMQVPGLRASGDALAAGESAPSALAKTAGLSPLFGQACDLLLALATFASLIGFINYGSRFVATLSAERMLPDSLASVGARFHTPGAAIITLGVLGFVTMTAVMTITRQDYLTVYYALATLLVYFWVIPYLLICAGAVVLLRRENRLTVWVVVCALVGASTMAWLYANGIVNPAPAPVNAMSYVFLIATAVGFVAFWIKNRRSGPLDSSVGAEGRTAR
ncbi:APC family permease [Mycolicibacterium palauense]|uniref:APC family permease n=1 Tax=Mycolicibacterium palauense TaxID=2034511 RepID=UPI000BFEEB44|nr:APC family permease [Mycolicibacterium palauense]